MGSEFCVIIKSQTWPTFKLVAQKLIHHPPSQGFIFFNTYIRIKNNS